MAGSWKNGSTKCMDHNCFGGHLTIILSSLLIYFTFCVTQKEQRVTKVSCLKPNTKFFDLKQNQFLEEIWLFLWFHLNLATLWSKQVETKYMSAWMWLTDTSQTMTVPSFAPVASLDPLWENLRNQTYDKTTDTHYFSQSCVLNVSLFSNTCWYYGVHWEERMVRFT